MMSWEEKRQRVCVLELNPRIQLTLFSNFKPFCCVASKHKSKVVSSRMESFSIFDHKFLYTCFLFSRLFFISKLSCVSLPSDKTKTHDMRALYFIDFFLYAPLWPFKRTVFPFAFPFACMLCGPYCVCECVARSCHPNMNIIWISSTANFITNTFHRATVHGVRSRGRGLFRVFRVILITFAWNKLSRFPYFHAHLTHATAVAEHNKSGKGGIGGSLFLILLNQTIVFFLI